ncbi:MAG: RNA polymerase sigma factor [Salibacteraceae bacterium]
MRTFKQMEMGIDKELLSLCIQKDRKAQFELYRQSYSILMSVCLRYEKNKEDATSLLNLGFLKVLSNLEKYSQEAPFEAWIRRIMINTIIDEFRKNRKQKELIEYNDLSEDRGTNVQISYNDADQRFDAEELQQMLTRLPVLSQKVFNLHVIDGYSHKEIGKMLDMSDGTSKWHVSFARKKLRGMIAETMKKLPTILL